MVIIYLILLTFFLVTGIKLCKIRVNNIPQYVLSPSLILVVSYYMYSISMPISRLLFASTAMEYDAEYMMVQMLGAAGILIGLYFQKYNTIFTYNRYSKRASSYTFLPILATIIMTVAVGVVMFDALKALQWNFSQIIAPYRQDFQGENEGPTLFGAILYLVAISSVVLAFIGAYKNKNTNVILITLFLAGLFSMFFLLRGHRNIASMMIIPIISVYFYSKSIKIKNLLLSCLCIYFIIYTVGVIRQLGFAEVAGVSFQTSMFDPLNQEFGTNYKVFTCWKEMGQDNSLLLGKSYTIDVLYNMVPKTFWPDRPPGAAIRFSMAYFGKSLGELREGLGFSPIAEALMNFSYIGIIPVFAFLSFFISSLESWFKQKGAWGIACYAFMIPIVVNWNRIDMATTTKMFVIFLFVSKVFATVMYMKKSVLYKLRRAYHS